MRWRYRSFVRLVLYTGKGGVGKTTTAAATAICAAERGVRTLIVSSDVAHSLGDVLDTELTSVPVALAPKLDAMEIDGCVQNAAAVRVLHAPVEILPSAA